MAKSVFFTGPSGLEYVVSVDANQSIPVRNVAKHLSGRAYGVIYVGCTAGPGSQYGMTVPLQDWRALVAFVEAHL